MGFAATQTALLPHHAAQLWDGDKNQLPGKAGSWRSKEKEEGEEERGRDPLQPPSPLCFQWPGCSRDLPGHERQPQGSHPSAAV